MLTISFKNSLGCVIDSDEARTSEEATTLVTKMIQNAGFLSSGDKIEISGDEEDAE